MDICHRRGAGATLERAGWLSLLPALIALGGLVYWLIGVVLFRLFRLSVGNLWQSVVCGAPVVFLVGYLINFYVGEAGVVNKYLVNEEYRGRLTIVYNHPDGFTPATHGDTTIFVLSPNGLLLVDIPYEPPYPGGASFYYMRQKVNS